MHARRNGYVFTLLAIVIFTMQDAVSKHLGAIYPPVVITMIRYWAFAIFVVLMAARAKGGLKAAIRTRRPILQLMRGVLLAGQIVTVIFSFTLVGLAHTQGILAAGPIFIALLSMVLLGERVGWRRWSAIGAGLVGVLIIINPVGTIEPAILVPLLCSAFFALYAVATRLVSREDSASTSFFYTGIGGALVTSLIGPFFWQPLAVHDWGWMALLCLTGMSSHFFLIKAYEYLDASEVQPISYIQVVFASIVGVTVFGETLTPNMIVGTAIVVGAGIFTIWRESVVGRRTAPPAEVKATGDL
ncbi:hypothetical protein BJF93_02440 [Xaviernesmea oryzae]|uniref:EamA domain-containing protein n=1 Tax=Xaviernesmea oryzae TaxID=464029 RepID=A0A1Q9AZ24_9HYPH|nr:DMT family transporter [Xaviernesmea oryzae]OLP60950.1 hypothetical protein BJF93_02440 [Xaviernesmea oryzae]SEL20459.1 Permease of the drug/metabolite transporter (DMT) superfamily [Xaviernesmea oryzae]